MNTKKFSRETRTLFRLANNDQKRLKHLYLGTEHIVLGMLALKDNHVKDFLNGYGVTYEKFDKMAIERLGRGDDDESVELGIATPLVSRVVDNAHYGCEKGSKIQPLRLLQYLLLEGEGVALRLFLKLGIDLDDMYEDLSFAIDKEIEDKKAKELLDSHGRFITEMKFNHEPCLYRNEEVMELLVNSMLMKKPNSLIIGEAGVGKTALIEQMAYLINNKRVPKMLEDTKIFELNITSTVSGMKYRGEFEEKVQNIVKELRKIDNLIVFIDEFHTTEHVGQNDKNGLSFANILKPALARGDIRVIGATTIDESKIIEDKAYKRRFNVVKVDELDARQTLKILGNAKSSYEKHFDVKIKDEDLKTILEQSSELDGVFPDKSLNLLERKCAKAIYYGFKELTYVLDDREIKLVC